MEVSRIAISAKYRNIVSKDKDNLKISKVIREEINEICNYMEMHLDEK